MARTPASRRQPSADSQTLHLPVHDRSGAVPAGSETLHISQTWPFEMPCSRCGELVQACLTCRFCRRFCQVGPPPADLPATPIRVAKTAPVEVFALRSRPTARSADSKSDSEAV